MSEICMSEHQDNVYNYVPLKSFFAICIMLLSFCDDNIISIQDKQLLQIYPCIQNGITRFECKRSFAPVRNLLHL